jgi:Flp pilus assembly protein TadG
MLVTRRTSPARRGVVVAKVALLLIPIMGFLALAVDYGYLLKIRTDLQSAADAAALAAARDLVPASGGSVDLGDVRDAARDFARENVAGFSNFSINDTDIQIGRYDPSTIYTQVSLLNSGTFDTVRVTLRRDNVSNSPVRLFFARAIGIPNCEVTASATAVLQRSTGLRAGADVVPFAISKTLWDAHSIGQRFRIYDDRVTDEEDNTIPGNWGTVDIGAENNSTKDISDQIINGLRQKDIEALYEDGRISSAEEINAASTIYLQADPGLSSGMKDAVEAIHGTGRIVPIYDSVTGSGNNAEFRIVGWGGVVIVGSRFDGAKRTHITMRKSTIYDGALVPAGDLSSTNGTIANTFTAPVLVE